MITSFVQVAGQCIHFGLSTDTKPASSDGFVFIETDTGKVFNRESGVWVEKLNSSYELTGGGGGGSGLSIPGMDGIDGEDGIDGLPGIAGIQGIQGTQGIQGIIGPPGIDAEELELPYIIPGERGPQGPAGGGGASATTIEVNLSATATWRGKFTITDAAISATSKVLAWQAPGPYTGKGTRADEAELQPVNVIAVNPATGSAEVFWETPPIIAAIVDAAYRGLVLPINTKDAAGWTRFRLFRRHKVRGNVKFSYVSFS